MDISTSLSIGQPKPLCCNAKEWVSNLVLTVLKLERVGLLCLLVEWWIVGC